MSKCFWQTAQVMSVHALDCLVRHLQCLLLKLADWWGGVFPYMDNMLKMKTIQELHCWNCDISSGILSWTRYKNTAFCSSVCNTDYALSASRVFSTPNTAMFFTCCFSFDTHSLPVSSMSLGVHSTTFRDLWKTQRTLETWVEQLQLAVQHQQWDTQRGSSYYRSRQQSLTPNSEWGCSHYYPSDWKSYGDSSYDRNSDCDGSYRVSKHKSDRYCRQVSDCREDRQQSQRSPSPAHVRFHSSSHTNSDKVNYKKLAMGANCQLLTLPRAIRTVITHLLISPETVYLRLMCEVDMHQL